MNSIELLHPSTNTVTIIKSNFDVYMAIFLINKIYEVEPEWRLRDERAPGLITEKAMEIIRGKNKVGEITNLKNEIVLIWRRL